MIFEVTRVCRPRSENETAWLRNLESGEGRWVTRWRLKDAYTFVGDFGVPAGYRIVECPNPREHCFVDPFGNVTGSTRGAPWDWKMARDAAAEHARGLLPRPSS